MIGPIYLFAMHVSRARRTEPAGQREKDNLPREKPPKGGANNRLESGLVAVQCKPTSGRPGGCSVTRDASSSRDIRRRSGGV